MGDAMRNNYRLIIGFLILAIVAFGIFNFSQLDNEIKEKQYDSLIHDLSIVTINFNHWISIKKDMLNTSKDVVDNFTWEEITQWHIGNPYLNINNNDSYVSQIYIGLSSGDFITGGQWVPPTDYDPRTRVWYIEAVEADDTIVSDVYIDRETGDSLVTISSPLYINDEFVGVISADVFLNNIHEYLEGQIVDNQIYAYLVEEDGTIIAHTKHPEFIGQNIGAENDDNFIKPFFDQVKATDEIVRMTYTYDHDQIIGVFKEIGSGEWYMAVALVDDTGFLNLKHMSLQTLVLNVIILCVILMLIFVLTRMKREVDHLNDLLKLENEKDFLTGVYNRRYYNLLMERLWIRDVPNQTISILIMDIDLFKQYNDTYGHIMGDDVLKKVAKCISNHIRENDVLVRYGGEEFSLVLDGTSKDAALMVCDKIKNAVYDMDIVHETSPYKRITISIGVTTVKTDTGIKIEEAIDQADIALYSAKAAGRNTVVAYE